MLVACSSSETSGQDPGGAGSAEQGERSGLPSDEMLSSLSVDDQMALCTWWEGVLGVGRVEHCSECNGDACTDYQVATSTLDECMAWLGSTQCNATVEQAENCAFAQDADFCATTDECALLDGC